MNNDELFTQHFMSAFCELSRDRVINVRITLSEVILNHYKTNNKNCGLFYHHQVQEVVKHLQLDIRDISEIVADINIEEESDGLIQFSVELSQLLVQKTLDSLNNTELDSD